MKPFYLFITKAGIACKRRLTVFVCSLLSLTPLFSQTSNISGIVNTYHKIIEIIPAKACVRVADITGLDINSYVMIVQMKGASVDQANGASFGTVTAMNGAGDYEIGTVCYIIGDSVFLFHNLLNTYNYTSGKVQLVQFGQYYSANIVDTVKAASWDSTAGTGGVIALFADQDITVNAPIYADSSGYAGGPHYSHTGNCNPIVGTGYFYNPAAADPTNGAYKGEGIATVTSTNYLGGRGAYANGGGGGNNHNNSGGGGSNLSAGGLGGRNSSSGPFNCNLNNNSGVAGWPLNSSSGTKIFLGGGGGAGHANNGTALSNYGGNGGGIVFIWATNLWGSDTISANGGRGGASTSDGAGGGGAGGTIVLNINNYSPTVKIKTNGGNGGNSNNSAVNNRCFGGGGGGSGGAIYFSGPVHSNAFMDGGIAGQESNSLGTCSSRPGVDGIDGTGFPGYVFPRSTDPAGYCTVLLPVQLISFNASLVNKKVFLKWEVGNPADIKWFVIERSADANQWTTLRSIATNNQVHQYNMIDENPPAGKNYYRIRFIEINTSISYSPVKLVITGDHSFTVYPNPASGKISVRGNFTTPADMRIADMSGKIIYQKNITTAAAEIDLPHLTAGIYLLWLNQSVQKIVIR